MAEPIGPGDWVECVDASPPSTRDDGTRLIAGHIYQAKDVGAFLDGGSFVRVTAHWGRWRIARFRPIYRPRADLIESLKAPPKRAPKRQREAA